MLLLLISTQKRASACTQSARGFHGCVASRLSPHHCPDKPCHCSSLTIHKKVMAHFRASLNQTCIDRYEAVFRSLEIKKLALPRHALQSRLCRFDWSPPAPLRLRRWIDEKQTLPRARHWTSFKRPEAQGPLITRSVHTSDQPLAPAPLWRPTTRVSRSAWKRGNVQRTRNRMDM